MDYSKFYTMEYNTIYLLFLILLFFDKIVFDMSNIGTYSYLIFLVLILLDHGLLLILLNGIYI